jgi:hypothetical protein
MMEKVSTGVNLILEMVVVFAMTTNESDHKSW